MLAQKQLEPPSQTWAAGDETKETTYSDPSGAMFSLYSTHALKIDESEEIWKGNTDGILVFTGIFSSTVATFIAMSYPYLQQDPNVTTQSLLVKISQQLATPNGTSPATSPSTQSSPSALVVFVNSVWFLSLVLSLTCALIATLLQQWARRYLQMIQRNHAPHVRTHIREYFSRGARKFGISSLVEILTFLLLVSVLLFFAGLVVFAYLANHIVAYITLTIVGFSFLSYIAITVIPLIFHDCPYYTPFTPLIWYTSQLIPLCYVWSVYRCKKLWYDNWGTDDKRIVESFRRRKERRHKSLSEGMMSRLESSATFPSMHIYKTILVHTLNWLREDRDLEQFVAGVPGLCESEALTTYYMGNRQHPIRNVLAALPGPRSFHPSLPWSIIQLAQRAFTSKLPGSKPRSLACLKALYYIPGAIRDLLAPYAAEKTHSSKILPLLDSPESLEIIYELQKSPSDDVAIPARCVAAVVAAYMITPSAPTTPTLIGDNESGGEQFLNERLRIGGDGSVAHEYHTGSDSARLQNIVCFLTDIREMLGSLNRQWWTSKDWDTIRRERAELLTTRHSHTTEYRTDYRKFDQQLEGDRTSPGFVSAAQLDLITLTLEILVRDPITDTTESQRKALRVAYEDFKKLAFTQAVEKANEQGLRQRSWIEAQAEDGFQRVEGALENLFPQTNRVLAADLAIDMEWRASPSGSPRPF